MSDNVNKPSHYNAGGIETIDGIRAALGDAFLDYCRGNVLKYVWRCRHKGKLLEDLRKAAKYLEWAIAEAESEKPNELQPLAIPEGWRELEENEPLSEDDLFDLDGEWVGHECDPSGGVYSSRIYCRHIRKIKTEKPEPLAIPEGWRELNEGELLSMHDLYELNGEWTACKHDPLGDRYNSRIHKRHIRKIETEKPEHVEGVWVEEADANAKKIESTETSDASIPDPGPGYRLLSKDPPEPVVEGDEFLCVNGEWYESENWRSSGRQCSAYYRRKIEPTEWIPKVGDRVRVVRGLANAVGEVGIIKEFCPVVNGEFLVLASEERCVLGWLKKDDLELIEAAQ